jgi:dUTP pyrophosphatase
MPFLKFKKVRDVKTPEYGNRYAAGMDFFVPNDYIPLTLDTNESALIKSGIIVELDPEYCLLGVNKSSRGSSGLVVGACLIDSDYRGEIHLNVWNVSKLPIVIKPGEKLVQFIYQKAEQPSLIEVDHITETNRGKGAFGSTGLS